MSIQLLTWSYLKRVKSNEIGVESIEASARAVTLCLLLNPTSRDFRVVTVILDYCFVKGMLNCFITALPDSIWIYHLCTVDISRSSVSRRRWHRSWRTDGDHFCCKWNCNYSPNNSWDQVNIFLCEVGFNTIKMVVLFWFLISIYLSHFCRF